MPPPDRVTIALWFGLAGVGFCLPFETIGGDTMGHIFTPARLWTYGWLALAVCFPLRCLRRWPAAFWGFLVYALCFLLNTLIRENTDWQYNGLRLVLLFQMSAVLLVTYNLCLDPRASNWLLGGVVAGVVIAALGFVPGLIGTELADDRGRFTIGTEDANTLGGVFAVGFACLLGIGERRARDHRWWALLTSPLLLLLAASVVRTGSRAALLATMAGAAAYLLVRRRRREMLVLWALVLLAIAGMMWQVMRSPTYTMRWRASLEKRDAAGREFIYPQALAMWKLKPVLGWGPGHYQEELGRRVNETAKDAHNTLLSVLLETGLAGALPFVIACGWCVLSALKGREGRLGSAPMALCFCVLVVGTFVTWHYQKAFALAMGLGLAAGLAGAEPRAKLGGGLWLRLALLRYRLHS